MTTPKADDILKTMQASLDARQSHSKPYQHWFLENCLPQQTVDDMLALPFEAPELHGVSGKREVHNATRSYFDVPTRAQYPVTEEVSQAFQSNTMVSTIESSMGISLKNTNLRLEFALDKNEFWLEPHTDLGVKLFTMLLYLSKDPAHAPLGTDIYADKQTHYGCSPFKSNGAMIFVPSNNTWHGFEKKTIQGKRVSLIINYVTQDWKAREQLSFPNTPV
jgi:hypothetical protein